MEPPIEELLDKVDSKFTLVALSAKRGRQINSYYNQLGEGLGYVVPPQVTSVSGKSLTIAFEEIAAGKAVYVRRDPDAVAAEAAVEGVGVDAVAAEAAVEGVGVEGVGVEGVEVDVLESADTTVDVVEVDEVTDEPAG
jgi:DNA-directed RNA polymerase subunit omega